ELRLVHRDVLDADAGIVAIDLDDAVDEQERIAVRNALHDPIDVGDTEGFRRVGHGILISSCRAATSRLLMIIPKAGLPGGQPNSSRRGRAPSALRRSAAL